MRTDEPPSYRLFTFHLDGKFGSLRLDWKPGLTEEENADELYSRFHRLMELRFPGCFRDGRVTHLGFVDGFHSMADAAGGKISHPPGPSDAPPA